MMITIMAGAAHSISGGIEQSVTKNPIAEPGILGNNARRICNRIIYFSW